MTTIPYQRTTDIVAYTYKADQFCLACILSQLSPPKYPNPQPVTYVELALDYFAALAGVDRRRVLVRHGRLPQGHPAGTGAGGRRLARRQGRVRSDRPLRPLWRRAQGRGRMNEYLIEWVIQLEADSPADAASQALGIVRDDCSTATVFFVTGPDGARLTIDAEDGSVL